SPISSHSWRTLNAGWPTSIRGRLPSAEGGSFFFEPVQFHLEPTDLLVQLRLVIVGRAADLGPGGEHRLDPGEEVLLPAVAQRRVAAVVPGQFVDRAVAFERRQGDLGLERRRVLLPFPCHTFPFPGPSE